MCPAREARTCVRELIRARAALGSAASGGPCALRRGTSGTVVAALCWSAGLPTSGCCKDIEQAQPGGLTPMPSSSPSGKEKLGTIWMYSCSAKNSNCGQQKRGGVCLPLGIRAFLRARLLKGSAGTDLLGRDRHSYLQATLRGLWPIVGKQGLWGCDALRHQCGRVRVWGLLCLELNLCPIAAPAPSSAALCALLCVGSKEPTLGREANSKGKASVSLPVVSLHRACGVMSAAPRCIFVLCPKAACTLMHISQPDDAEYVTQVIYATRL